MCAARTRSRVAASSRRPTETAEIDAPSQRESEDKTRSTPAAAPARTRAKAGTAKKDEAAPEETNSERKGSEMTQTQTKSKTRDPTPAAAAKETNATEKKPTATTKPAGKKRKAEEQLDEEMAAPLAARAQGIRKLIGAHVSASGGMHFPPYAHFITFRTS